MTVFDLDAETMADQETVTVVDPKLTEMDSKQPSSFIAAAQRPSFRAPAIPLGPNHGHHDGAPTHMFESAGSSPTTTLSTTDSSPLTDPSPSSSPDSPLHLIPLNSYHATSFGVLSANRPTIASLAVTSPATVSTPPIQLGGFMRPMTSPSPRRPRNMKGLSIQPPSAPAIPAGKMASEPASPSFIRPKIATMKRKPSQLSLNTGTLNMPARTVLEVPPSPAMVPMLQRRALKHSLSTPHILTVPASSTFGPPGGMTFPKVLERNESGLSEVLRPMRTGVHATFDAAIAEEGSSIRAQTANRAVFEPFNESVNNEDLKTPGYPDGPIAIYGDNVFLYLEPTAQEASRFDTVFNVAREVLNPFKAIVGAAPAFEQREQQLPTVVESPLPLESAASFATAFEFLPSDEPSLDSPTTPKAKPMSEPEYIHMPWDHNTDIAPDLMKLCETIDNRIKSGKKVLIHCQQGASRSASLIIAYGLYQKPSMSVNDAYYAAQAKSRWISPNMKLMYSLQDFHKELSAKNSLPSAGTRPRTGRSPTKHRLTMSADAIDVASKEPRTAPLPGEDVEMKDTESDQTQSRPRGRSNPGRPSISPGPATAPPTVSWGEDMLKEQEIPVLRQLTLSTPALPQPREEFAVPSQPVHSQDTLPAFTLAKLPQRPKFGLARTALTLKPAETWPQPPPTPGFGGSFPSMNFHQKIGFSFIAAGVPEPPTRAPPPPPPSASLLKKGSFERTVAMAPAYPEDEPLMSPRAEIMTENPLHKFADVAGMSFADSPPTPTDNMFSPRATMFPRDPFSPFGRPPQVADPRSPPCKGETPIVRSIDNIL